MERLLSGIGIQRAADAAVRDLPWVTRTHPFGPEHDVYKVRDKVFLMATEATGEPIITLKAHPDASEALREEFPSIRPGYHMNKRHWISVAAGEGVTAELVRELVVTSYDLVVATMVVPRRPIRYADPSGIGLPAHDGADPSGPADF